MSKKIKAPIASIKPLSARAASQCFIKKPRLAVSLQYMTTNNRFSVKYFKKDLRSQRAALLGLHAFLADLCAETRLSIGQKRKTDYLGYEEMLYGQIYFNASGITLGKDQQVCVFRFGETKGDDKFRLLGFFRDRCPILYIIGFDFSYKAYNHGN